MKNSMQEGLKSLIQILEKPLEKKELLIGLDGFVDTIFHVVKTRTDAKNYTRYETISEYAAMLAAAAGKSANVELACITAKSGGNGGLMADSLACHGHGVRFLGNLGYPEPDEVFKDFLAHFDSVHSFADAGYTDAFEFSDGKLMMGRHHTLNQITWDNMIERIGLEKIKELFTQPHLVATNNWCMLLEMNDIWEKLQTRILPNIELQKKSPFWFIDLADPAKRTHKDLRRALDLVLGFQKTHQVIMSFNLSEAEQIASLLTGEKALGKPAQLASLIHHYLPISFVVVHGVADAGCSYQGESWEINGPYSPKPRLTTGAGDNFNAGFCAGLLAGADPQTCLYAGVATSGFYVRHMQPAQRDSLLNFSRFWLEHLELSPESFDQKYFELID